jgi:outer membrane biosynthesis protein TonB
MSAAPVSKKRKRKEVNPLPWVLLAITLIVGAIWFVSRGSKPHAKPKTEESITITLPPPPPPVTPPPPPPPVNEPPPPEEEEMIAQEPVPEDEPSPEEAAPEPPSDLDIGPGSAGGTGPALGGGGGGKGTLGSNRRGSASKYGWYAAKVQSAIRQALSGNPSTRSATLSLQVKIWADADGRITRAQLVGSSGNPSVDQSIKSQVLTGLQLPQAPPADMPMPINLRITARKPAI